MREAIARRVACGSWDGVVRRFPSHLTHCVVHRLCIVMDAEVVNSEVMETIGEPMCWAGKASDLEGQVDGNPHAQLALPPMKRKAPVEMVVETVEENKRYRSAMNEMAEELLCPITHELPVEPVMAEDCRVYERSAIKDWLDRRPEGQVKSPVTNEPMGKKLLPAVQVRNTIKSMVQSGAISGAKADAWKERIAEEEEVAEMRRRAAGGDSVAIVCMGCWYRKGQKGIKEDLKEAFNWFRRAADLEDPGGMCHCGVAYLQGWGCEEDKLRGLIMLTHAAALGAEHGCYLLGMAHRDGSWGVRQSDKEASRWYGKMAGCTLQNSSHACRDDAAGWLREHPTAGAASAGQ